MDETEQLQGLHQHLVIVPRIHERLSDLRGLGPASGSPALADLELPYGEYVRTGAMTAIGSSLDHLVSWSRLFLSGSGVSGQLLLPMSAHFTLLRAAMEGASTARWLVDPAVEARVRVARGIGNLLMDLGERSKFERMPRPPGAPPPPPSDRTALQRIAEAEEAAAAAGLCPLKIGRTDVVRRFGSGEPTYRLMSAFAHGGQAIPLAASKRETPDARDAGGLRAVQVTADVEMTARMTYETVVVARQATREVFAYHGHTFDE